MDCCIFSCFFFVFRIGSVIGFDPYGFVHVKSGLDANDPTQHLFFPTELELVDVF